MIFEVSIYTILIVILGLFIFMWYTRREMSWREFRRGWSSAVEADMVLSLFGDETLSKVIACNKDYYYSSPIYKTMRENIFGSDGGIVSTTGEAIQCYKELKGLPSVKGFNWESRISVDALLGDIKSYLGSKGIIVHGEA